MDHVFEFHILHAEVLSVPFTMLNVDDSIKKKTTNLLQLKFIDLKLADK